MFTGLAALVSAIAGLLGGSVPRMFELFEKKLTFAQEIKIREMEFANRKQEHELQLKLAEANISGKIEESTLDALKAEIQANAAMTMELMKLERMPTGYALLDAINAGIRPFFFVATILMFFIVVAQVIFMNPEALSAQAATQFWIAAEGVMGWVCGYRSAVSKIKS